MENTLKECNQPIQLQCWDTLNTNTVNGILFVSALIYLLLKYKQIGKWNQKYIFYFKALAWRHTGSSWQPVSGGAGLKVVSIHEGEAILHDCHTSCVCDCASVNVCVFIQKACDLITCGRVYFPFRADGELWLEYSHTHTHTPQPFSS